MDPTSSLTVRASTYISDGVKLTGRGSRPDRQDGVTQGDTERLLPTFFVSLPPRKKSRAQHGNVSRKFVAFAVIGCPRVLSCVFATPKCVQYHCLSVSLILSLSCRLTFGRHVHRSIGTMSYPAVPNVKRLVAWSRRRNRGGRVLQLVRRAFYRDR